MSTCNVCLENKSNISYCENCMESGKICHSCLKLWAEKNDITICSICKKKTMKNLPINEEEEIKSYFSYLCFEKIFIWLLIVLMMSLMFSSVSYFLVFRFDEDEYISKFYIVLGCGCIFGAPFTVLFRHFIGDYCNIGSIFE